MTHPTPFRPQAPSPQRSSAVREAPKTPPARPLSECRPRPHRFLLSLARVLEGVPGPSHGPRGCGRPRLPAWVILRRGSACPPVPAHCSQDMTTRQIISWISLSWTPFILPVPRGRTALVVGPTAAAALSLGAGPAGQAGPAGLRLLQASCLLPLLPHRSLLPRLPPLSSPCSLSRSGCFSFHLASLSLESTCLPLAAPVHHSVSPIPTISGSLPASLPLTRVLALLPISPRPSAGRLSAAWALCSPHSVGAWLCWADPGAGFPWDLPSSCCQGRGSWLAGAGGRCPPGESPEFSLAPPGWESTGGSDSGLSHLSRL